MIINSDLLVNKSASFASTYRVLTLRGCEVDAFLRCETACGAVFGRNLNVGPHPKVGCESAFQMH